MHFLTHVFDVNGGDAPRQKSSDMPLWHVAAFFGVSPDHLHQKHKRAKKCKSFGTALLILSVLFISQSCFALSIPEKPSSYVNDYASLLSAETKQKIEILLGAFEKETSNQVVVAIFPSLDGQVLEDFSIKLAEKWKIGSKKNNNGVILLIFKEEHAVRIEVGYGLEGALPDALAGQIIRNEIAPAFRQGNYDAGVINAVNAIIAATRGEYKAKALGHEPMEEYGPWLFFALFTYIILPIFCYALVMIFCVTFFGAPGIFLGTVIVILLIFFRKMIFSHYLGSTFSGRGGSSWGGGGFSSGSFGGGGFSGGGGGSFGGGGASGRW